MKLRAAASVFAIAAAISACSSSSNGSGPASVAGGTTAGGGAPVTAPAGSASGGGSSGDFCAKLMSANGKLATLPSPGSSGDFSALKAAIDQEAAAFQELGNGAPASVKPSIDDIVSLLQQAEGAFANPSSPDLTKLSALGTKLPTDLTALSNYIGTNCTGG
jgi:hypothetical protein